MCMIDGSDGPLFYWSRSVRARKPHTCCECRRTIDPGESYELVSGKWEDSIDVYKTCVGCLEARQWLAANCNGWMFDMVLEDLQEHIDTFPNDRQLMEFIYGIRSRWGRRDAGLYESVA